MVEPKELSTLEIEINEMLSDLEKCIQEMNQNELSQRSVLEKTCERKIKNVQASFESFKLEVRGLGKLADDYRQSLRLLKDRIGLNILAFHDKKADYLLSEFSMSSITPKTRKLQTIEVTRDYLDPLEYNFSMANVSELRKMALEVSEEVQSVRNMIESPLETQLPTNTQPKKNTKRTEADDIFLCVVSLVAIALLAIFTYWVFANSSPDLQVDNRGKTNSNFATITTSSLLVGVFQPFECPLILDP